MGTNFYAIIPIKKRFIKDLKEFSDNTTEKSNVDYIKNMLNYFLNELHDNKIHLGKRSAGWAFLWDLNEFKYYDPTLESIHNFIIENKAYIEDEYGQKYSWEDFINNEIGYCLHPSENPMTLDEVIKSKLNQGTKDNIIENYINKNIPYYRFCTSKTYKLMNPDEPTDSCFMYNSNFINVISNYSKSTIDLSYTDFVSKDNLRFSLFTDFS